MINLPKPDRPAGDERRRTLRIPLSRRVISETLSGGSALTTNISHTGLCLTTAERIEPGKELELKLQLHEDDFLPIRFQAVCCWTQVSGGQPCTVGLDLINTNSRSLSALRKYLDQVSPESESKPMRVKTSTPLKGQPRGATSRLLIEAFSEALHSLKEDPIILLRKVLSEELSIRKISNPSEHEHDQVGSHIILELWLKSLLAQDPQLGSNLKQGLHRRKSRIR